MKVRIHIMLKKNVLDVQGKAIAHTLDNLGYTGIHSVRQGKYIELDLAERNTTKARRTAEQMCRSFLANTVLEDFTIETD